MPQSDPQLLVTTDWLAKHLSAPDVRVLDGSWFLPTENRDPKKEYEAIHIPGARFFDIDEIADSNSELPHMAPPVEKFISRARALGIGDGHRVVIYDNGANSAFRVWWMFRLFGKEDVAVLDGGLPKWIAEGREIEDMPPMTRDRHLSARRHATLVRDVTQVAAASKLGSSEIIDARAPARFRGEADEPRTGLRKGRIPGSKNVFFKDLFNEDGTMKPVAEQRALFEAAGVDLSKPAITTCGSGVTAAVLSMALERMGHRNHALYDGSWAEWGLFSDLKVETG